MRHPLGESLVAVVALTAALAGCGGNSKGPELARVQGTVSFKGQPLKNATVVFFPNQPGARPASGITGENGRFELMTEVPGDGVVKGQHRVSITAREAAPELSLEQQSALSLTTEGAPVGKPLIPEKYFRFETSGLTTEIKSGANTTNFELKE